MNALLTAAGGFALLGALLVYVGSKVISHLVGEEIEGRINQLGYAILHLVCRRLPQDLREVYYEWWAAELDEYFQNAKELPLTRLFWALRFPLPLLITGRKTARIQDPSSFEANTDQFVAFVRALKRSAYLRPFVRLAFASKAVNIVLGVVPVAMAAVVTLFLPVSWPSRIGFVLGVAIGQIILFAGLRFVRIALVDAEDNQ
ncbi:hypothetical protein [Nocardia sp. CA-120079]|uniref:hypothetical protein n=1 Tax=Nocardia sp. CA-120079 TaxID=3239974 RepID=UPI003D99D7F0